MKNNSDCEYYQINCVFCNKIIFIPININKRLCVKCLKFELEYLKSINASPSKPYEY